MRLAGKVAQDIRTTAPVVGEVKDGRASGVGVRPLSYTRIGTADRGFAGISL